MSRTKRLSQRPLQVSLLEPRVVPAVVATLTPQSNDRFDLTVVGDAASNEIRFFEVDGTFQIYGPTQLRILKPDNTFVTSIAASRIRSITVDGGDGNDTIDLSRVSGKASDGRAISVSLLGGRGNDTLIGSNGVDRLSGGDGNDRLEGNDGDDTLSGGAGNDWESGGCGNDTIGADDDRGIGAPSFPNDNTRSSVGNGTVPAHTSLSPSTFGDDAGDDIMIGGADDDTIRGGSGNDTLSGQSGDDLLRGGRGDDLLQGGDGDDREFGDSGDDRIGQFWDGIQWVDDAGNDRMEGGDGDDTIDGGSGDDDVSGFDGADRVYGGTGNDLVSGGLGNDILIGWTGEDELTGDGGDDTIQGNAGNDTIWGDDGDDTLSGGLGDDELHGGKGNDRIEGDDPDPDGTDPLSAAGAALPLFYGMGDEVDCDGEAEPDEADCGCGDAGPEADALAGGEDQLWGDDGDDTLSGGGANDTLFGGNGADKLSGDDGDDWLSGDDGADELYGNEGRDVLAGGMGNDVLLGGAGKDLLRGDEGTDLLDGGSDENFLTGGSGSDVLMLQRGGKARVTDFAVGEDQLGLGAGVTFGGLRVTDKRGDTWLSEQPNSPIGILVGVDYRLISAASSVNALDPAGDTRATAASAFPGSLGWTVDGWVDTSDRNDDYAFALGAENDFTATVDSLARGATVSVLNFRGETVASATGDAPLSVVLAGGEYRLRVSGAKEFGTPYRVSLTASPRLAGITSTASSTQLETYTGANAHGLIRLRDFRGTPPLAAPSLPQFAGIDGSGGTIVIIDTGINLNHVAFGPDGNGDGVSDRIVFDRDFVTANNSPDADGDGFSDAVDTDGHGSNVASVAASSDPSLPGIAPGANIIALKVFKDTPGKTPGASDSVTEQALQWVVSNFERYNIVSVNISIGDSRKDLISPTTHPGLGDEFQALANLGVVVAVSAGNDYFDADGRQGISNKAADPNVIGVGAVYDGNSVSGIYEHGERDFTAVPDQLAVFTQRATGVGMIFAPGVQMDGASIGGPMAHAALDGTSQASPVVAGTVALMQQLSRSLTGNPLTPSAFRQLALKTGRTIFDGDDENSNLPSTMASYLRLDIDALGREVVRQAAVGPNRVSLTIDRLEGQLDSNSPSDFFAVLKAGNQERRFPSPTPSQDYVEDMDAISPNWTFSVVPSTPGPVPIGIEVYDYDDGLNGADDIADLNPVGGTKPLYMSFDPISNLITNVASGAVIGRAGERITSVGNGDDGDGIRATFTVESTVLPPEARRPVDFVLHQVSQPLISLELLGNLLAGNVNKPDFFAVVRVGDGPEVQTPTVENQRDASFGQVISGDSDGDLVPIRVRVFNRARPIFSTEPGPTDVNPGVGVDVLLVYDRATKEIRDSRTGAVLGRNGDLIRLVGDGSEGADSAILKFTVRGG